ncbi:MAG: transcriptional repressor [Clostridia bacterium]|nr:transcriptional repressor [Clostridia bacterium]
MSARISAHARTVLNLLAERRCHLTAEEILAGLDGIGTATVYRALDHLTELGLIRRLSLGKKSAVYEYIRDSHMHFVCSRCSKVYDVQADLSGMIREASKICGHHVNWGEVTAHGMCSACLGETGNQGAQMASEA